MFTGQNDKSCHFKDLHQLKNREFIDSNEKPEDFWLFQRLTTINSDIKQRILKLLLL